MGAQRRFFLLNHLIIIAKQDVCYCRVVYKTLIFAFSSFLGEFSQGTGKGDRQINPIYTFFFFFFCPLGPKGWKGGGGGAIAFQSITPQALNL